MGHIVCFLAFALAGTAVFGRVAQNNQVQFEIEAKETMSDEDHTVAVDLGNKDIKSGKDLSNRLVSLEYVKAIKNSKLWNEVKTKALSGSGPVQLAPMFAKYESLPVDQWPETIVDEVQRLIEDGLKCVVMDQLYMMSQYLKTGPNGEKFMHTVVTKVTNVLSDFKKIYERSTFQYNTVIDAENPETISESIMKVVKDNNQMCKSDQVNIQMSDHQVDTWVDRVTTIDDVLDTIQSIVNKQKNE